MMRMLIVGYCYGIRSERKLLQEVSLNLAYRWLCQIDPDDAVPDHSTFSKNRRGRFRNSGLLRLMSERVVGICLAAGLTKVDSFAVDESDIEADSRRDHGIEPEKLCSAPVYIVEGSDFKVARQRTELSPLSGLTLGCYAGNLIRMT
jgi:transposase